MRKVWEFLWTLCELVDRRRTDLKSLYPMISERSRKSREH
jgi:hypothetical protein